jgi:Bacterial aa3 type cytochrome c oxidase subunit IV.
MSEHEHGKMNIDEQERTFAGFMRVAAIGITVVAAALIFLALVNG